VPRSRFRSRRKSRTRCCDRTSSPIVGSSRKSTSGRCRRAASSSNFMRSPSESLRTCTRSKCSTSSIVANSSRLASNIGSDMPYISRCSRKVSMAGISQVRIVFCPMTRAMPEVGKSKPHSIFSVVVLPAPFGPRNPTISPCSMQNETASTAMRSSVSRW